MKEPKDIKLSELLPQRPPFVMIDRLVSFEPGVTVTELRVTSDNIFFENGHLTASGLIENIAQTCASRIGCINLQNEKTVKIGVIGSITNLNIKRTPIENELLTTKIELIEEVFGMSMVLATIASNEEVIVTSNMKIALTDAEIHE